MNRGPKILVGIMVAVLIAAVGIWLLGREASSITVINTAPYRIAVAIAHPLDNERWQTIGWFTLDAGETQTYESVFWWVEPAYYVVARQQDFAVVRHLHGDKEPVWGWTGNDLLRQVNDGRMRFATDAAGRGVLPKDAYAVGFSRATGDVDGEHFAATFSDPLLPHLSPASKNALPLPDALREAKRLAASLQRRVSFLGEWEGKAFPFHLGIVTDDSNTFLLPGVTITAATDRTRDNYPMRLHEGDQLLQFGGNAVYSDIDVLAALYEHATNVDRGVEVPISFVVVRGESLVSDSTNYFFNRDYWGRQDSDAFRSALVGLRNAVFLGAGCAGNTLLVQGLTGLGNALKWLASELDDSEDEPEYAEMPSYKQLRWACAQHDARMRQFEPDAFSVGSFAGMFVPSSRLALGSVAGKSGRALVNSAGGTIALEVAESVVWTVADGSPMRTSEDLADELRDVLPLAAASGVLQGSMRFGKR